MTTPTGPAAGVHLPWARVPGAVRAWTAQFGAGSPQAVRDLSGGFSPGATVVLAWPGRSVFIKAVGTELNPESPDMHRREATISAALPASPRFPRLLATYDDGDWVALAFEAVDGRPPRHPWEEGELAAVSAGLSAMHRELTPSPAPGLEPLAVRAQRLFGGGARWPRTGHRPGSIRGPSDTWPGWPSWKRAGPRLAAGSTLVHGDVRGDNVLLTADGGVVFVDWPHAAVGNPAFDLVAWAPSVVLEGGPQPEELLARYRSTRGIEDDAVTVLLAAISGFFVSHSFTPSPPGLPTLRPFQAAQGAVALAWLERRTGWRAPASVLTCH